MLRLLLSLPLLSCHMRNPEQEQAAGNTSQGTAAVSNSNFDNNTQTIHVMVALCDNKYQGIVPVPAKIGNGHDPDNNLYWGCAYGIRTYFKNSKSWTLLQRIAMDSIKMERLVFKNKQYSYYLVADAYNGKYIKDCTVDFFESCSGKIKDTLQINGTSIGIYGMQNCFLTSGMMG